MINRFILYCLLVFLIFPLYAQNIIINPGMELSNDDIKYWRKDGYNKTATKFVIETGKAHSGRNYVSIISDTPNDAQLIQSIPVKSDTNYRVSGHIMTENVGEDNVGANLSVLDQMFISKDIKGTSGKWEYVEFYIAVKKNVKKVDFCLRLGGYGSVNKGKASFDDISFEETGRIPKGADWISIGGKTRTSSDNPNKSKENKSGNEMKRIKINTEDLPYIFVVILIIASAGFFIFLLSAKEVRKKEKK